MKLVPFQSGWAGSETKLDLKGIYRRPSADGGISLTSPLPLRRHLDWTRKGFEFVALATREDLGLVAGFLRAEGHDVAELAKSYDPRTGIFLTELYLKDAKASDAAYLVDLQSKVDRFGAETVTEMMQMQDPGFVMPAGIVIPERVQTGAGEANQTPATQDREPEPEFAPVGDHAPAEAAAPARRRSTRS